ncbi:MAG TPA: hypothetical protein VLE91_01050 [Candidatus Saccharimonadales bacterium]|nr:hypothetical protein [Candidatus Saccharimonadales bacterium]
MLPTDLKYRATKIAQPNIQIETNLIGRVKVKILVVFCFVFASLIGAQLVFANNLATDGPKISEIYTQIDQIEAQNTQLKVQIAQNSALASLQKEAQSQGFAKPAKVIAP